MGPSVDELERLADRITGEFYKLYLRVPRRKRGRAYQLFIDVAEGRITYEQALRKLRELAR
ncbi:MAG: hypothetical protein F7C07_00155 [Desulfurococcales archaeon]|nr:hypothetical protein [Desulfurococcales archaeon]